MRNAVMAGLVLSFLVLIAAERIIQADQNTSQPAPVSVTVALPTGTNTIGSLKLTDGTLTAGIDPCKSTVARSSANISQTAGTQIITGTASKQTYICSLNLLTATAQNVALVEGTGTTCGTGTAGMAGGTTAATGWNFSANAGLVSNGAGYWVFKTATAADNVCLLQGGTGQVSGNVTYVQN